MHVLAGLLDVGNQHVDRRLGVAHRLVRRRIRVAQQRDAVAAHGAKAVDGPRQIHQRCVAVGRQHGRLRRQAQRRRGPPQPFKPPSPDAGFAQQQVRQHTHDGQQHDGGHPGHARSGRAVGARQRAGHGGQVRHEKQARPEQIDEMQRQWPIQPQGHAGFLATLVAAMLAQALHLAPAGRGGQRLPCPPHTLPPRARPVGDGATMGRAR